MVKKNLYKCHVFVCTNRREGGRECCAAKDSEKLAASVKAWAKELYGRQVRINKSGCLDFCESGIAAVIYPAGEWHLNLKANSEEELKAAIEKFMNEHSGENNDS